MRLEESSGCSRDGSRVVVVTEVVSSDPAGKYDIFGHDGDSSAVDGTEIGVFEESYEVSLGCLLQNFDGC